MKRVLALLLMLSLCGIAQSKGKGKKQTSNPATTVENSYKIFSASHRETISTCLNDKSGLPPGLAKRESLPPGLQKHIQKKGKLPPGLQKKVQPLPAHCQVNLPKLPGGWERIVLGDRVIVLDPAKRIIDWFNVVIRGPRG